VTEGLRHAPDLPLPAISAHRTMRNKTEHSTVQKTEGAGRVRERGEWV
jgi:hypothetical protein